MLFRQFSEVIIVDCKCSKNRFETALLYTVECTCIKSHLKSDTFSLAERLRKALGLSRNYFFQNYISEPRLIIADRDIALLNPIDIKFPFSKNILYAWHITTAIKSHPSKESIAGLLNEFIRYH